MFWLWYSPPEIYNTETRRTDINSCLEHKLNTLRGVTHTLLSQHWVKKKVKNTSDENSGRGVSRLPKCSVKHLTTAASKWAFLGVIWIYHTSSTKVLSSERQSKRKSEVKRTNPGDRFLARSCVHHLVYSDVTD